MSRHDPHPVCLAAQARPTGDFSEISERVLQRDADNLMECLCGTERPVIAYAPLAPACGRRTVEHTEYLVTEDGQRVPTGRKVVVTYETALIELCVERA